jgi:hypothetical protein
MKKKTRTEEKSLTLSLFGDPPAAKVELDESEPKQAQDQYERMNAGDMNCACE